HEEIDARLAEQENHFAQLPRQHDELKRQGETRRQQLASRLQSAAVLQNQIEAFQKQLISQEAAAASHQRQLDVLAVAREAVAIELLVCQKRQTSLEAQTAIRQREL